MGSNRSDRNERPKSVPSLAKTKVAQLHRRLSASLTVQRAVPKLTHLAPIPCQQQRIPVVRGRIACKSLVNSAF